MNRLQAVARIWTRIYAEVGNMDLDSEELDSADRERLEGARSVALKVIADKEWKAVVRARG